MQRMHVLALLVLLVVHTAHAAPFALAADGDEPADITPGAWTGSYAVDAGASASLALPLEGAAGTFDVEEIVVCHDATQHTALRGIVVDRVSGSLLDAAEEQAFFSGWLYHDTTDEALFPDTLVGAWWYGDDRGPIFASVDTGDGTDGSPDFLRFGLSWQQAAPVAEVPFVRFNDTTPRGFECFSEAGGTALLTADFSGVWTLTVNGTNDYPLNLCMENNADVEYNLRGSYDNRRGVLSGEVWGYSAFGGYNEYYGDDGGVAYGRLVFHQNNAGDAFTGAILALTPERVLLPVTGTKTAAAAPTLEQCDDQLVVEGVVAVEAGATETPALAAWSVEWRDFVVNPFHAMRHLALTGEVLVPDRFEVAVATDAALLASDETPDVLAWQTVAVDVPPNAFNDSFYWGTFDFAYMHNDFTTELAFAPPLTPATTYVVGVRVPLGDGTEHYAVSPAVTAVCDAASRAHCFDGVCGCDEACTPCGVSADCNGAGVCVRHGPFSGTFDASGVASFGGVLTLCVEERGYNVTRGVAVDQLTGSFANGEGRVSAWLYHEEDHAAHSDGGGKHFPEVGYGFWWRGDDRDFFEVMRNETTDALMIKTNWFGEWYALPQLSEHAPTLAECGGEPFVADFSGYFDIVGDVAPHSHADGHEHDDELMLCMEGDDVEYNVRGMYHDGAVFAEVFGYSAFGFYVHWLNETSFQYDMVVMHLSNDLNTLTGVYGHKGAEWSQWSATRAEPTLPTDDACDDAESLVVPGHVYDGAGGSDVATQTSLTELAVSWMDFYVNPFIAYIANANYEPVGVTAFQVAAATSPTLLSDASETPDVVAWTNVLVDGSHTEEWVFPAVHHPYKHYLAVQGGLTIDTVYYVAVRVLTSDGPSEAVVSDGVTVVTSDDCIGTDCACNQDGAWTACTDGKHCNGLGECKELGHWSGVFDASATAFNGPLYLCHEVVGHGVSTRSNMTVDLLTGSFEPDDGEEGYLSAWVWHTDNNHFPFANHARGAWWRGSERGYFEAEWNSDGVLEIKTHGFHDQWAPVPRLNNDLPTPRQCFPNGDGEPFSADFGGAWKMEMDHVGAEHMHEEDAHEEEEMAMTMQHDMFVCMEGYVMEFNFRARFEEGVLEGEVFGYTAVGRYVHYDHDGHHQTNFFNIHVNAALNTFEGFFIWFHNGNHTMAMMSGTKDTEWTGVITPALCGNTLLTAGFVWDGHQDIHVGEHEHDHNDGAHDDASGAHDHSQDLDEQVSQRRLEATWGDFLLNPFQAQLAELHSGVPVTEPTTFEWGVSTSAAADTLDVLDWTAVPIPPMPDSPHAHHATFGAVHQVFSTAATDLQLTAGTQYYAAVRLQAGGEEVVKVSDGVRVVCSERCVGTECGCGASCEVCGSGLACNGYGQCTPPGEWSGSYDTGGHLGVLQLCHETVGAVYADYPFVSVDVLTGSFEDSHGHPGYLSGRVYTIMDPNNATSLLIAEAVGFWHADGERSAFFAERRQSTDGGYELRILTRFDVGAYIWDESARITAPQITHTLPDEAVCVEDAAVGVFEADFEGVWTFTPVNRTTAGLPMDRVFDLSICQLNDDDQGVFFDLSGGGDDLVMTGQVFNYGVWGELAYFHEDDGVTVAEAQLEMILRAGSDDVADVLVYVRDADAVITFEATRTSAARPGDVACANQLVLPGSVVVGTNGEDHTASQLAVNHVRASWAHWIINPFLMRRRNELDGANLIPSGFEVAVGTSANFTGPAVQWVAVPVEMGEVEPMDAMFEAFHNVFRHSIMADLTVGTQYYVAVRVNIAPTIIGVSPAVTVLCQPSACFGRDCLCTDCAMCAVGFACDGANGCAVCTPQCDGKVCGDDGCGGTCGSCADNEICTEEQQCQCVPNCENKMCGDDGCGGLCDSCAGFDVCDADHEMCVTLSFDGEFMVRGDEVLDVCELPHGAVLATLTSGTGATLFHFHGERLALDEEKAVGKLEGVAGGAWVTLTLAADTRDTITIEGAGEFDGTGNRFDLHGTCPDAHYEGAPVAGSFDVAVGVVGVNGTLHVCQYDTELVGRVEGTTVYLWGNCELAPSTRNGTLCDGTMVYGEQLFRFQMLQPWDGAAVFSTCRQSNALGNSVECMPWSRAERVGTATPHDAQCEHPQHTLESFRGTWQVEWVSASAAWRAEAAAGDTVLTLCAAHELGDVGEGTFHSPSGAAHDAQIEVYGGDGNVYNFAVGGSTLWVGTFAVIDGVLVGYSEQFNETVAGETGNLNVQVFRAVRVSATPDAALCHLSDDHGDTAAHYTGRWTLALVQAWASRVYLPGGAGEGDTIDACEKDGLVTFKTPGARVYAWHAREGDGGLSVGAYIADDGSDYGVVTMDAMQLLRLQTTSHAGGVAPSGYTWLQLETTATTLTCAGPDAYAWEGEWTLTMSGVAYDAYMCTLSNGGMVLSWNGGLIVSEVVAGPLALGHADVGSHVHVTHHSEPWTLVQINATNDGLTGVVPGCEWDAGTGCHPQSPPDVPFSAVRRSTARVESQCAATIGGNVALRASVHDGAGDIDVDVQTSRSTLRMRWNQLFATTPLDGWLWSVEWAVGTSAGAADVRAFTQVVTHEHIEDVRTGSAVATDLSLVDGTTYYSTVRFRIAETETAATSQTLVVTSDGVRVDVATVELSDTVDVTLDAEVGDGEHTVDLEVVVPAGASTYDRIVVETVSDFTGDDVADPTTTPPAGNFRSVDGVTFSMTGEGDRKRVHGATARQVFAKPLLVTVAYDASGTMATEDIDPYSLMLAFYDTESDTFVDATTTCTGDDVHSRVHVELNTLEVHVCHFTQFALFGQPRAAPAAPGGLVAGERTTSSIALVWQAAATSVSLPVTGYTVEMATDDAPTTFGELVTTLRESFTATNLQPDESYHFRVRATNAVGTSPYSHVLTASTLGGDDDDGDDDDDDDDTTGGGGSNAGAIAGGVIGALVGVALVVAAVLVVRKKRGKKVRNPKMRLGDDGDGDDMHPNAFAGEMEMGAYN